MVTGGGYYQQKEVKRGMNKMSMNQNQVDKIVNFLDSEREKHEGVGLADFHIECITVAYNQGRIDQVSKEKEFIDNRHLEDIEKDAIVRRLKQYDNNRSDASRSLGMSERTLYRKINYYELGRKSKILNFGKINK